MGARGASELCTLIEARAKEFNHVNVATAFRKLLQNNSGPHGVVERAQQALEAAALRTIDAFGAQAVANTLHIMAKSRYRPWDRTLVPELEGRAEALAGSFKAQEVANTLWAYATMGREPGAGVMRGLEGRAEALAGTFNAQDVANTLWAYATRHEARRACRVGGRQRQQQAAEAQRGRHSGSRRQGQGQGKTKEPGRQR